MTPQGKREISYEAKKEKKKKQKCESGCVLHRLKRMSAKIGMGNLAKKRKQTGSLEWAEFLCLYRRMLTYWLYLAVASHAMASWPTPASGLSTRPPLQVHDVSNVNSHLRFASQQTPDCVPTYKNQATPGNRLCGAYVRPIFFKITLLFLFT